MSNLVILYHGGCPDGFTAAWAAWKRHPDATFIPVYHTDPTLPSNLEGKDVFLIDFCYKREKLLELKSKVNSLLVLDHHQSAIEDCEGLDFCTFDLKRSGAGLSWDYFNPGETRPWIVNYVEYRDLGGVYHNTIHPWEDTEEVLAAIDSFEKTFDNWEGFIQSYNKPPDYLYWQGEGILRYRKTLVKSLLKFSQEIDFDGEKVLSVNTPVLQSEVAKELARDRAFGVCWSQQGNRIKFSLRSEKSGSDVCKIAQTFIGGGGHLRASGFDVPGIDIMEAAKKGKENK